MEDPAGTTLWAMVLTAGDEAHPERRQALDRLVQLHWRPVYHLFRRLGVSAGDAPDLTQEFFTRLLERDALRHADPERGRFRNYLQACARNFLINERQRRGAQKRGGGTRTLSLDFDEAERLIEPWTEDTVERAFDRQWALDLLESCIRELERDLAASGREALFEAVRGAFALDGTARAPTYARVAREQGITEPEVAGFVFKARRRLREILRERVRASVQTESEVDDEVRSLFAALG